MCAAGGASGPKPLFLLHLAAPCRGQYLLHEDIPRLGMPTGIQHRFCLHHGPGNGHGIDGSLLA
jgi:hypothetical protein